VCLGAVTVCSDLRISAVMGERTNTRVCAFDMNSPRFTAFLNSRMGVLRFEIRRIEQDSINDANRRYSKACFNQICGCTEGNGYCHPSSVANFGH
jgi:hypothetical protein